MQGRARRAWSVAREVYREFQDDKPMQLAASLSYYTLLSLGPLLLVVVAVAGLKFEREAVEGRLVQQISGLIGEKGAEVVQTVLQNVHGPGKGVISLVIGIVTLILGATTVFIQLQSALNTIWDVKADPKKKKGNALWALVRDRVLSLTLILGVGFLLLVSLVVSAGLSAAGEWVGARLPIDPHVWQFVDAAVSFGIITLLIAMIFKFLPDAEITWRDVRFGSLVTALLFVLGKYVIGLYLGKASIGSAYGAAGSVIVLMVWIYYAAVIFFLGAEITHVHTRRKRGDPAPVEYAVEAEPQTSH
jgi:membrane protein